MHANPRGYHQLRICDKNQLSEDGEEYKADQLYQTTTNAFNISHIPTLTSASHRCSRYERTASQVSVISLVAGHR